MKQRRDTPRRRSAPQWTADEWEYATHALMTRSGGVCEHCGSPPAAGDVWERHHRIRRRDGGDRLSNLLLLLRRCHAYITDHPDEAYANGWSIRALDGSVGPEEVPVRYGLTGRLWLLDDYGNRVFIP